MSEGRAIPGATGATVTGAGPSPASNESGAALRLTAAWLTTYDAIYERLHLKQAEDLASQGAAASADKIIAAISASRPGGLLGRMGG